MGFIQYYEIKLKKGIKEVDKMSSSFKSPVDTAKAISATAGAKNSANVVTVILLSFLAGADIAFGGS